MEFLPLLISLLLVFFSQVKAQTPTVSGTSSLTDGEKTTLTCSSDSSSLNDATYEWYADGSKVSGANSNTYITPAVSMSDDGKVYTCKVVVDTVTSDMSSTSVALIVVPQTPSITGSSDVTDASSFTLTCVTASTGLSTPRYVWTIGTVVQNPESSSALTQIADINTVPDYSCKVSGNGGTDYSTASITFTPSVVPQTPSITSSSDVTDASSFTLTCVTASTGLSTPMYVWTIGTVVQNPESSSALTQIADINTVPSYSCKVSGNEGTDYSATSITFTPSVKAQTPTVSGTPSRLTDGETTTLTCSSDSSPLNDATYEWYAGGSKVSDTSSNTYTTPAVGMSDDGKVYTCKVVFNGVKSDISSNSVTLTVVPLTPSITSSSDVTDASSFTLTCVTASTGLSTPRYVWTIGTVVQNPESSSALTQIADINTVPAYSCKVSGNGGTDYSAASITFTPSVVPQTPSITSSSDVTDASSFTLTCVTASTGLSTPMYVWTIGTVVQNPESSSALTQIADINTVPSYSCKVSGNEGTDYSATSITFTPSVKAQTPTVSGTPSRLTDGETTTLTCSSDSSPLNDATYEWYAGGSKVSDTSSNTYTTPAVGMSDDGKVYTCKVVFNGVKSDISSNSVTLTVVPLTPSITSSSDVTDASSFTLTCVTASTGLSTPRYVWTIGTVVQNPESSSALTQMADINTVPAYSCKVSGNGGTDYSAASITFTPSVKAQTPTVSGTPSRLTDGETTTLTCSSDSSPLKDATYEWYAGGSKVRDTSSNTYTTPAVGMSDDGKVYTCKVVFNGVASDISSNSVALIVGEVKDLDATCDPAADTCTNSAAAGLLLACDSRASPAACKIQVDQICNTSSANEAKCVTGASCDTGTSNKCKCGTGHTATATTPITCDIDANKFGGSCTADTANTRGTCDDTNALCSATTGGTCSACKTGFTGTNGAGCAVSPNKVGGSCTTTTANTTGSCEDANALCSAVTWGTCGCKTGYSGTDGAGCVKEVQIDGACTELDMCTPADTLVCDPYKSICVLRKGADCKTKITSCPTGASCTDKNLCECGTGYDDEGDACKAAERKVGGECNAGNSCFDLNAECKDGLCHCKTSYKVKASDASCERSGVEKMMASVLCLVMALLLSRLL